MHWQQTKVGTQASAGKCNVGTVFFFLPTPRHYFPLVFQLTLINSPCRVGWLAGWLHVIVRRQTGKTHTNTATNESIRVSSSSSRKKVHFPAMHLLLLSRRCPLPPSTTKRHWPKTAIKVLAEVFQFKLARVQFQAPPPVRQSPQCPYNPLLPIHKSEP